MRRPHPRRKERGQSLVELALALPILVILLFGIIDFGMGLRSYIALTNAAREGGRYAALGHEPGTYPADCDGSTNGTVTGRVCVAMEGINLNNVEDVEVDYPAGQDPGAEVIVSASYTYEYITPLGDIMNFFSGGSFPEALPLNTSTSMRLE